jgi:hypothetical protein
MMTRVPMTRALGILTIALLCSAALLAGAASGHEFVASKLGKGKARATTAQFFEVSAGTIECAKASGVFEVSSLHSETIHMNVGYTECTAFGQAIEVSPADYELNASGTIAFAKALTISPSVAGCDIVFGTAANRDREAVSYANNPNKLRLVQELSGLSYTSSGGICGAGGKEGKLEGTLQLELEGGTIEWR